MRAGSTHQAQHISRTRDRPNRTRNQRGKQNWTLRVRLARFARVSSLPHPWPTMAVNDSLERLVLEATGARAVAGRHTLQSLWSGYGEIQRVELEPPELRSVIVKRVTPPRPPKGGAESRSHARKLRSYAVEMAWYGHFASRLGGTPCRVPALLASHAQGEHRLFVLEDLDAAGYPSRRHRLDAIDVQDCLTWLAQFHATFLGTPPERLWKTGTYWHLSTRPDELASMTNHRLKSAAAAIDGRLQRAGFQSLVHGDAKLENFCFPERGASSDLGVAAVDFQYVGGGAGIKDVAYFFSSIWESAECDAQAADALNFYFEALRAAVSPRLTPSEANALEQEWRALYPLAWADFCRFLEGWAPGYFARHAYSQRMTEQALGAL